MAKTGSTSPPLTCEGSGEGHSNSSDSTSSGGRSVFDTRGAADYLGVSTALLELLRVRGGGPAFVKLSRLVRYRKSALDAWLLSRERNHT